MKTLKKALSLCLLYGTMLLPTPVAAGEKSFASWLKNVRREAVAQGIDPAIIKAALPDTLQPVAHVVRLDRKQPETPQNIEDYLKMMVTHGRIKTGREKIRENQQLMHDISAAYGVEPEVYTALWGMETSYGKNTGKFNVAAAAATLAYEGRRGTYFKGELFSALRIMEQEHIAPADLKGSWAAAMGQVQFMPSTYLGYAVDFDKDGRRDIWTNKADVLASGARYVHAIGWKKGEKWGERVTLPAHFNRALLGMDKTHALAFWRGKGIKIAAEGASPTASVVQPGGAGTQTFIVYDNARALMKWNNSFSFAASVGTLADSLKIRSHKLFLLLTLPIFNFKEENHDGRNI